MSDLDRILKLASHGTADAPSQAPAERELKDVPVVEEPTTTREAVGEFAEPIYDLIDMHFEGDCQPVFDDLVRFLSGDQIKEFVDDFRRHHELPMGDDDENFGEGNEFSGELEKAKIDGKKLVLVEAVYSMDGDSPDLIELLKITKKHNASIIVDEAHSFGLVGENGLGIENLLKNIKKERYVSTFNFHVFCDGVICWNTLLASSLPPSSSLRASRPLFSFWRIEMSEY